jgi:TIR domain
VSISDVGSAISVPATQAPGASVTTFDGTVFISYARADDEQPPGYKKVQGWITFFWQQLRFELTNSGLAEANLWLDRYEIDPTEDFTKRIEDALHDAKLVIVILSPNWVKRPWCLREAAYFAELHPDATEKTLLGQPLRSP